jgi:hypothetical protein
MRHRPTTWLGLFGLAVLSGCGDSGGGVVDPIGDYFWGLKEADCRHDIACGRNDAAYSVGVRGSVERCVAYTRLRSDLVAQLDSWRQALELGTVTFNAERAEQCLSWARELPCDIDMGFYFGQWTLVELLHPECIDDFEGQVELGGECRIHKECRDGWCDGLPPCAGTCRAFVPEGMTCGNPQECTPGLHCDGDSYSCVSYAAQHRLLPEGQACGEDVGWCLPDLWCDAESRSVGQCRTPVAEGQACWWTSMCAVGQDCISGLCTPITLVDGAGATCGPTRLCDPLDFLDCDEATNRCVPFGESGDECNSWNICRSGLACAHGMCLRLRPAGAPCIDGMQCASTVCEGGVCGTSAACS